MATADIYGYTDAKAHSPRNAFDTSFDTLFNSPAGMLLPAYVEDVKAGDKLKLSCKNLTRTNAVNTAAYMSFSEKVDFFFVPYRLLWSAYNQWRLGNIQPRSTTALRDLTRMSYHPIASWEDLVYRANPDDPGEPIYRTNLDRLDPFLHNQQPAANALRLLDLLGYGLPPVPNITAFSKLTEEQSRKIAGYFQNMGRNHLFNYFRLAAFQCIYMYRYRNEDYEPLDPSYYNADSLFLTSNASTGFIRPVFNSENKPSGYLKDQSNPYSLFYGRLSDSTSNLNGNRLTFAKLFTPRYKNWRRDIFTSLKPSNGILPFWQYNSLSDSTEVAIPNGGTIFENDETSIGPYHPTTNSISASNLRQLLAMDKFSRLAIYADKDYSSLYEAFFGVKVDEPDVPRYLGTFSSDIKISEVVATAAGSDGTSDASTSVLGELAGKGIGTGQSHVFDTEFKEDGIVMGIHYIMPFLYYSPYRYNKFVVKASKYDYYYPSFDGLGLSPVIGGERSYWDGVNDPNYTKINSLLGFNSRYYEYKQRVNEVHGTFAPGQSEAHWTVVSNTDFYTDPKYISKIYPTITNSIFGVNWDGTPSTDPFKCFYSFNVTKVSNMEASGVPGV